MKSINEDLYKQYPEDLLTNFDHSIMPDAENILKSNKVYSQYSAWDFCGYVWFENGKFYCEIWRYNSHINTIKANSLEEIMDEASTKYGYD